MQKSIITPPNTKPNAIGEPSMLMHALLVSQHATCRSVPGWSGKYEVAEVKQ